ncbi:c-type cytochrome [Capsulimonas corticalis]|nr:c-type cytochrome [Capsulimonas corticalis]
MSMVTKFVLWSLVLLALVGITGSRALWNNQNSDSKDFTYWQGQYKDVAEALATDPAVKQATRDSVIEVKQVTVGQFTVTEQDGTTQQRVDRCQSCHVGLLNPQMTAENIIKIIDHTTVSTEDLPKYLEEHPDTLRVIKTIGAHPGISVEGDQPRDLGVIHGDKFTYGVATEKSLTPSDLTDYDAQKTNLKLHPFPTFGCTTCHYGSGRELIEKNAHGDPEHWLSPMLAAKYMDAACAQCHAQYDNKDFSIAYLPAMTTIARGEKLFRDKACYGCHKIEGLSKGNIGPELTYEGRSTIPEAVEHQLWDPRYKTAACVMPYFFAARQHNTDDPDREADIVDPRSQQITPAKIENADVVDTLKTHGYIPDAAAQQDVDALVTFVISQTGNNYAASASSRMTEIASYNTAKPEDVPVSIETGKKLFESSGCYACHYIGDPNFKGESSKDPAGKGGVAGPQLTWEGSRHSVQWLTAHYENPQAFVPSSIMPIFPFSDSQRKALSLYDQSLRPAGTTTVGEEVDMPTGELKAKGAQTPDIATMTR